LFFYELLEKDEQIKKLEQEIQRLTQKQREMEKENSKGQEESYFLLL
jgi:hypothetical protein